MLISTPEELRAFLPSHTYRNLDTVRGYLLNSELTFLRQRIGQPLLDALNAKYSETGPIVTTPIGTDGSADDEAEMLADPWQQLIILCQRCIVYDAFARAADIMGLSANDMGLNVAESDNYDAANDKRVDRYKAQLIKEAHAATDLLFIFLETLEKNTTPESSSTRNIETPESSSTRNIETSSAPSPSGEIILLWRQSPTCYLCTGLLFNTATEFNQFVDIYDSRERFIQLLPDIRYCQELHLEAEVGIDLLTDLHQRQRTATLNAVEQRAYTMLQRCLSLYVEARAKMFNRPDARDEATGYMRITLTYIKSHQTQFESTAIAAMQTSPLYDAHLYATQQEQQHPHHHDDAYERHMHAPQQHGPMLISTLI